MVTARLKSAARSWQCAGCSYSTFRTLSPFSPPSPPIASTSAHTLDHAPFQPPAWEHLVPPRSLTGAKAKAGKQRAAWIRPTGRDGNKLAEPKENSIGWRGPQSSSYKRTPSQKQGKPPPVDPASVSPFLPLVTRERNFLLANLRQALHSRRTPFLSRSGRRTPTVHRQRGRGTAAAWDPDQVWNALARVLRYPEDVPTLPHSQLPSSTRAPAVLSAPSSATANRGFFTPAQRANDPIEQDTESVAEQEDSVGRSKIGLSLPELRRAFTVFASATPRTQNGLNRLLVVAELIAKHPSHARFAAPSHYDEHGAISAGEHQLQGGGVGLRDKDWAALVMFVGTNLRTARSDPEIKSALALFSQRLELHSTRTTKSTRRTELARSRSDARSLYNALLFVVSRAKMWELFEQILRRMTDAGIQPDATTLVELIKREGQRGAPISSAWSLFERGLAATAADEQLITPDGQRALWTAMVWALGRRGKLEEAMEIYGAMKSGKAVDIATLRPVDEHTAAFATLVSPSLLRAVIPPPPDDRIVTSLIQSCAYRGDFTGAIRILHDILGSHSSSSGTTSLRPAVHHFTPIFRAFARYGTARRSSSRDLALDRTTLGGAHVRAHAQKRDALPFAALSSPSSRSSRSTISTRTATAGDANSNPFTLQALWILFDSFLALQPPPTASLAQEPFSGARTAPGPKDIFWILFSFERLSGAPGTLLEVWEACEQKFVQRRTGGANVAGWTGWRMDKRVRRLVETHRATLAERKRRLDELQ
ncbi:hypothetical protein JCM10908_000301 [Rhodotorula pacifica]|uniref:pentatricopeptide repeat-containing protein n=1 Tax=Rhodotorula pacifica TaxID=1495444 RepID=UPI003177D4A1